MLIFMIIVIAVVFNSMKIAKKDEFFCDYSSVEQTSAINGIFTILIIFSHAVKFIQPSGILDTAYMSFRSHLGQGVVVTFLFYSGFGIMESIKKKGIIYVKEIPFRRLFKTWYHFAIAITLFLLLSFYLKSNYSLSKILLAYTGWSTIGNSNWYMNVIFVQYIIVFLSFMLFRKSKPFAAFTVCALTFGYAYFQFRMGRPGYCINTMACFPAGMLFSLIKPYFDKLLTKNDVIWSVFFAAAFGCYCVLHHYREKSLVVYSAWSVCAALMVVMLTMKVKIGNEILTWFSKHIFSIYILQRIPMLILSHFGISSHRYSFVIISFVITVAMATVFDEIMKKTDALIFGKPSHTA